MLLTKIFLDLDDTLNQFTMQALAHVGCHVNAESLGDFNPKWGLDIIKAANALHPCKESPYTFTSFWNMFSRNNWANFPKSAEFEFLLDRCVELVGKSNICILTTPVLDPGCAAGKIDWIYDQCPEWLHRQYLIGPMKHMCAQSDALLIDDGDHNVDAFREHGGQAILVPRPWNSLHKFNTRKYLEEAFHVLTREKHQLPTPGHRAYTW